MVINIQPHACIQVLLSIQGSIHVSYTSGKKWEVTWAKVLQDTPIEL